VRARHSPRELLEMIEAPGYSVYDQWAAQSQALVLLQANVFMYSSLPDPVLRAAMLQPTSDPGATVAAALAAAGPDARCAVVPQGPYVVPYVAEAVPA
jgi:nickel-dependent lactate racemase